MYAKRRPNLSPFYQNHLFIFVFNVFNALFFGFFEICIRVLVLSRRPEVPYGISSPGCDSESVKNVNVGRHF